MAVEQLPGQVREFASYLSGLMKRLDQDGGWCAVFWQRDPDGMRACLDGWEVPPWDVVEALLQDLAAEQGPQAAAQEAQRARALHSASLTAYDGRPGGRDALGDRLDVMLREQRYAAERQAELSRQLHAATTQEEADTVRVDLAWAHDDHERATARCVELRHRMENLDRRALHTHVSGAFDFSAGAGGGVVRVAEPADQRALETRPGAPGTAVTDHSGPGSLPAPAPTAPRDPATPGSGPYDPAAARAARSDSAAARIGPYDQAGTSASTGTTPSTSASTTPNLGAAPSPVPAPTPSAAPVPKQRSKRRPRGSARFAGMMEAEAAPVAVPETAGPPVSAPAAPSGRSPRGARFAGAAEAPAQRRTEALDEDARRVTAETVQTLTRLRREGRSGEAHAVLVEAAYWPAARFPLLAAELHRAGLDADWATLLWEAGSLPADRLVGAADALVAAGRSADGQQMLRQGVARPAPEIGTAVLSLADEGRQREIRALLDAYVRVRTPEEAARSAEADPGRLVPLLLAAAKGVSEERHWDLVHALRVAGFTA
ncbi:hypothetical protein [Streptomyces mirabilis]|uniref:hypothetical protein n=1 Tax=Streptomyces mirabilis TaxID=68239 RepID=UPI0036AF63BA